MTLQDKAEKTVKKLLALTQDQTLEWERILDTRRLTRGRDEIVDVAFQADHAGNTFLVYESRSPGMDADGHTYWSNRANIDLVDEDGVPLWSFPRMSTMSDLLEAIRVRSGRVEQRLDAFLRE